MNHSTPSSRSIRLALACAAIALLAGCKPSPEALRKRGITLEPLDTNRVLAVVNGVDIRAGEVQDLVQNRCDEYQARSGQRLPSSQVDRLRRQMLDQLIDEQIIRELIAQSTVTVSEAALDARMAEVVKTFDDAATFTQALERMSYTPESLRADVRTDMIAAALMQAEMGAMTVTATDVAQYYKEKPEQFVLPDRVTARHVLLKVTATASSNEHAAIIARLRQIRVEITNGLAFAQAARQYSECPSRSEGGLLGTFGRDEVPVLLARAAFALPVSNVSDVVETEMGAHLLYILGREAAHTASFEEVRENLSKFLSDRKKQDMADEWKQLLRARAHVEYK